MKGRKSELIDRVKSQFGNHPFSIDDCDPKTRQLVLKFLCFKKNLPNTTSINFEYIDFERKGTVYMKKVFRLKGGI